MGAGFVLALGSSARAVAGTRRGGDIVAARVAHQAAIDAIRYESVRDPEHGAAVAVLRPSCFKPRKLLEQHTWFLTVRRGAVIWQREGETFEFDAGAWRQ